MAESIRKFIESRRPRWEKLETTIQSLERGRLSASELIGLTRLYREATADLARLQTFQNQEGLEDELETYLNHLVARAYSQIYRSSPPRMASLWRFLRSGFPAAFRETLPWTMLALERLRSWPDLRFRHSDLRQQLCRSHRAPSADSEGGRGNGLVRLHSRCEAPGLQ